MDTEVCQRSEVAPVFAAHVGEFATYTAEPAILGVSFHFANLTNFTNTFPLWRNPILLNEDGHGLVAYRDV